MPNENGPVCACGVVVDLKSRDSSMVPRKLTIFVPKSKGNKSSDGKGARKQQDEARAPKIRTLSESGSSSSVVEPRRITTKSSKHEKRLNHSRRTRSADRAESHYTYIDSDSSILGERIREITIPEALYATIPDTPNSSINNYGTSQLNSQSRSQPLYAIPSMTSPPPTYDVAIAKTRQTGLPPTYEEYLCHKSRSHTPPPPWSDSITITSSSSSSNPTSSIQARREFLASQPELREYLAQLTLAQSADRGLHHLHQHHQQQQQLQQSRDPSCSSNQQTLREQQVRAQQRARAMPPRSQSVSRVQQQRIATMYEDAAFCMETTVLQSAFDQGFALCSLM
ncbi:uncharacterized protein LOC116842211 [Odontomachus brunneus]|uniref:uncharacterized protein LOC116842211 n=1 Tax=Odontomachus brunneus TaxID=486640 RepID=UPI0013F2316A|nr:uncharacterized protein LOC116842211 [Odontomachus brunneus]XP_032666963.1 uncharacterized protein LOC116842211 [Odontomachus brunneus]